MDNKKYQKGFIVDICKWITHNNSQKGHTSFQYIVKDWKLAYMLADKAIPKRVSKRLLINYGITSKVSYNLILGVGGIQSGELRVRIQD